MAKKKKLKEEFDEVDLFMSGRAYQVKLGKIGKDGEVESKVIKVFKKESD